MSCPTLAIPDVAFDNVLELFESYSWSLDDTPGGADDEISPDVLGYIFEKYINQKAFGAYYTRPALTEYLCEQTIHGVILDRVNRPDIPGVAPARHFETVEDLLLRLDDRLCRELLLDVLPNLSILDPACGSGASWSPRQTLISVYSAVIGRAQLPGLDRAVAGRCAQHRSLGYFLRSGSSPTTCSGSTSWRRRSRSQSFASSWPWSPRSARSTSWTRCPTSTSTSCPATPSSA
jgi:hypothetical protein